MNPTFPPATYLKTFQNQKPGEERKPIPRPAPWEEERINLLTSPKPLFQRLHDYPAPGDNVRYRNALVGRQRKKKLHRANVSMETGSGELVDQGGAAEQQSGRHKITGQLDKEIV